MPTIIPGPPDTETLKGKVRIPPGPLPGLPKTPKLPCLETTTTVGASAFANCPAEELGNRLEFPKTETGVNNGPVPPLRRPPRPFPGYQGLQPHRLRQNPEEERFARAWAVENRDGRTLTYILCDGHEQHHPPTPSARDFDVAATVVQWLGSPVGQCFLRDLGYESPKETPK